ncbi:MAG: ATP-binding protein [Zetaproteobacteria bacterium]|nr:ATP-binding protein [Zetaproteobacteria bacterium]
MKNLRRVLKLSTSPEPREALAYQVIVLCLGLAIAVSPLVVISFVHQGATVQVMTSFLVLLALALGPFLLRKRHIADKILYLLPTVGLLGVPGITWFTGGIHSVEITLLALIPVAATLFVNSKYGLMITVIVVLELILLSIASARGWITNDYQGYIPREIYTVIVMSIVVTFLWVISTYFENLKNQAILELSRVRESETDLDRAKSNFLASMSHEVRTPLHVILGTIELFRDTELSEEQRQLIQNLNSSSSTLYSLLNDIVDYEELSKGTISLYRQPLHIKHLIEDVRTSVQKMSQNKNIPIIGYFEGYLRYTSDPVRLKQVIYNLVSNGFKFTPEGGNILIRVYGLEHGFEIFIQDTGIGMDDEKLDQIFEAFGQKDQSSTREQGGLGLGLTISQKIIDLMGGTLEIHSKPEKGTTIKLFFPEPPLKGAYGVATAQEFEAEKSVHADLKEHIRILVVEDNQLNRELMAAFLREYSVVDLAENGHEALLALGKNSYDIIFMDFHMPILDGFNTTAEIRRIYPQGQPPFIIGLTADVIQKDKHKSLQIGMDDYMSKPVNRDRVFAKIAHWGKKLDKRKKTPDLDS